MKKQTFISRIENAEGRMVSFDRWSCKRPETIIRKHAEALAKDESFWRMIWHGGVTLAIYATPDGCNTDKVPVRTIPLDAL